MDMMAGDIEIKALDQESLQEAREVLKARFADLAEGYIEDAKQYIDGMEKGVEQGDHAMVAQHAHPLKSASAGLGMTGLAALAQHTEEAAKQGQEIAEIAPLLPLFHEALAYVTEQLHAVIATD